MTDSDPTAGFARSDWRKMVRELQGDDSGRLTTWEIGFLATLDGYKLWSPSTSQWQTLCRIWTKVFG